MSVLVHTPIKVGTTAVTTQTHARTRYTRTHTLRTHAHARTPSLIHTHIHTHTHATHTYTDTHKEAVVGEQRVLESFSRSGTSLFICRRLFAYLFSYISIHISLFIYLFSYRHLLTQKKTYFRRQRRCRRAGVRCKGAGADSCAASAPPQVKFLKNQLYSHFI